MRTFCLLLLSILFLAGCATVQYTPYTKETFLPKSKQYQMIIFPELLTHRKYKAIGRLDIQGCSSYAYTTTQEDIGKTFLVKAKKRGADGIINLQINSTPYNTALYMPGQTTYTPQRTYNYGTSSASAYNNYGGHAWGSGSYSGTSTTYIPTYNPGYTIPYTGVINSMSGDLIVLLDKDTYGYMGVLFDPYVKNIEGAMILEVQSGSAAEKCDLKKGDILITVEDMQISSLEDFFKKVTLKVDKPVKMGLTRNDEKIEVTLIPQKGVYN